MRPFQLTFFVSVCASLLLAGQASAQPLFGAAESIECSVLNSDILVLGKLVEFGDREQLDKRGGHEATIAVEETLKGEHRHRLRLRLFQPASTLADWKDRSCRLLLAARGDPADETRVLDLTDKELQVLTADFTLLRQPAEVIRRAKETVRRMPGVKRIDTFWLEAPREAVAGTRWESYYKTGGNTTLTVPVDERLEKRARDYVRSKSYRQREEGAQALRYFKSDENIAGVKALLNDPGWAYLWLAEENRGLEVRIYGVRAKAYQTLKYWGINVGKPTIRQETWKPERVRLADLSNRKVTEEELKGLGRFKNLHTIIILNTEVSEAGLKILAGIKSLRNLDLGGTKVTLGGMAELRERRPDLKIKR